MSTKIWDAVRTKPGVKLWPLIASIRLKAEKNIRKKLEEEIQRLLKEKRKKKVKWTRWQAFSHIQQQFRNQHQSPFRNWYGMDVSLAIRERRGRLYIIPYANGCMRGVLDFLKRDPRLEDFHYQNQTDKSARISDKRWETRGRIWDELDLDDTHWNDRLVLEIFHPEAFFRIGYPLIEVKGKQ
jgi:hypothetical protein